MPSRFRVALLIETSRGYGRGVLRGVAAYAHAHGPWSIDHQEQSLAESDPPWLRAWRGDGVLARLDNPHLVRRLNRLSTPIVGLSGAHSPADAIVVQTPDEPIVALALDHLRERGFSRFAFCGFPGAFYSDARQTVFEELLASTGEPGSVFRPRRGAQFESTPAAETAGLADRIELSAWLGQLPKPIGLLACNDIRGQFVLETCRAAGIAVPDEIAVIGVDDDDLICDLCDPALSSVRQDTFQIGYRAAETLHALMHGDSAPGPSTAIHPPGVAARASTDTIAVHDRGVAAALRFIREHVRENIRVPDVASFVGMSRSTLERRFEDILQRSPKAEIDRARLDVIARLLRQTDRKLEHVAQLVGFPHPEYLIEFVKSRTGKTPGQLRHELQAEAQISAGFTPRRRKPTLPRARPAS